MKDLLHFVEALDYESFVSRNGATIQCYQGREITEIQKCKLNYHRM